MTIEDLNSIVRTIALAGLSIALFEAMLLLWVKKLETTHAHQE